MPASVAPISYASSIVGFLSFAFTFFTFVRVFWETILTLWSAPKQIHGYMDNLRVEIHNERLYFKTALKRSRSKSKDNRKIRDTVEPLRVLNHSVGTIHREFKKLEAPFLETTPEEEDRDIEKSVDGSVKNDYAPMTLGRRWRWMRCKSDIISLADQVNRIQTQRIACDLSNVLMCVHSLAELFELLD